VSGTYNKLVVPYWGQSSGAMPKSEAKVSTGKIDTQVVLPVLLKELDHIQAIIGRYDTFFFLMKQLCLGAIFAIVGVYLNKPFDGLGFLIGMPLLFYIFEYMFRYSFWSGFIIRVLEIEKFLNCSVNEIRLYKLNASYPVWPRARLTFKTFDLIFYMLLIGKIYLLTHLFGGNPWRFSVHNS
jgi:hypothetical protein